MVASEIIEFNGLKYRRYIHAKGSRCNYYRVKKSGQQLLLHVEIYRFYVGEIPEGFVIHHRDFDPLNNSIDNLQCMSSFEHKSLHNKIRIEADPARWKEICRKGAKAKALLNQAVPNG